MYKDFQPVVYILFNRKYGANYTGVTSNLMRPTQEHREGLIDEHSKKHGINRLVWYELHSTMKTAIQREKQIKKWNRDWKINLIEELNPDWRDLAIDLGFAP